jgi:hypothetical protein
METRSDTTLAESSWGYLSDDLMADADRRAAAVDQRRVYLVAQMKKRGLEPVGEVIVTRLDDKAEEAPPGCSGYQFEIRHELRTSVPAGDAASATPLGTFGRTIQKRFFTRDGVEYVSEDADQARTARPGERYANAADVVHARRKPYGRQYGTRH